MDFLKIGLLGHEFYSGNRGCAALAYSMLDLLLQCAVQKKIMLKLYIITTSEIVDQTPYDHELLEYHFIHLTAKRIGALHKIFKALKECDIVYDLSEGDSFSDIYGMKRFIKMTALKQCVLCCKVPLVLCPQTYGPYYSGFARLWAGCILEQADHIYTRDNLSADYISSMCKNKINTAADIAFLLPYTKRTCSELNKIKFGINLSGLLWSGGYTGKNQFRLTVDYQQYHKKLIEYLIKAGNYEIYLIPHVISVNYESCENDLRVCELVHKLYPDTIIADINNTPADAKSYISGMDMFTGARMHATIAAFSTGVLTIPFSYSRKFEGLYSGLGYPFIVGATRLSTKEALDQTIEWINDSQKLKEAQINAQKIIEKKLDCFQMNILNTISHVMEAR